MCDARHVGKGQRGHLQPLPLPLPPPPPAGTIPGVSVAPPAAPTPPAPARRPPRFRPLSSVGRREPGSSARTFFRSDPVSAF